MNESTPLLPSSTNTGTNSNNTITTTQKKKRWRMMKQSTQGINDTSNSSTPVAKQTLSSVSTTSFPRTVVINLPRSEARRQHMMAELGSQNVDFSWINAVDGSQLSEDELSEKATTLGRWFMTKGMIGCFLSHRQCWEECVQDGQPLLVFEDDVILGPNFKEIVQKYLNRCNEDDLVDKWDVLMLGAFGSVHPKRRFDASLIPVLMSGKWRRTYIVASLKDELHGILDTASAASTDTTSTKDRCIHVPMCPYGAYAYIITPQGASKLLRACPKAQFHLDLVAWGQEDLNIFAVHPLIAYQTNEDSTLGGSRINVWYKNIMPPLFSDSYTGVENKWFLSSPLLRVGGPFFNGKLVLTNGLALGLASLGLVASCLLKSLLLFKVTLLYFLTMLSTIRFLMSKYNRF